MMTIKIVNKPLTPNGEQAMRTAYKEQLSLRERLLMWKNHVTQQLDLHEKDGQVKYLEVVIKLPGYVKSEIMRERMLEANKILLSEKGAWSTDYNTEITIIATEIPHG